MNKAILIGRIGKDIELRHTNSGTAVASISMATSKKIKGEQITHWHRLIFWGPQAETVTQYLKKGDQLAIEGEIEYRSYQDKDGNNRDITEIVADQLRMLGRAGDENSGGGTPRREPQQERQQQRQYEEPPFDTYDPNSDIPF